MKIKGIDASVIQIDSVFHVGLSGSRYGLEATVQLRKSVKGISLLPVRIPLRKFRKTELISFITQEAEKELERLQKEEYPEAIECQDTELVRKLKKKLNTLLGLDC